MKVKTTVSPLFSLHLEYSQKATLREKEYRTLENRFQFHFGFFPVKVEDESFLILTEKQQDATRAFWSNPRVIKSRSEMVAARTLAEAYFNAFADCGTDKQV